MGEQIERRDAPKKKKNKEYDIIDLCSSLPEPIVSYPMTRRDNKHISRKS